MATQAPYRPRVSRETRLLFVTVVAAVVALWVLARLRFPEQPASVNPVAPVLTQLAPTPAFGDLAAVVSDVQNRVLAPFVALPFSSPDSTDAFTDRLTALRLQDDLAVALLPSSDGVSAVSLARDASVMNIDRATGLAALKVPPLPAPGLTNWSPGRLTSPRYLLSTVTVQDTISLRPVFISTMATDGSDAWEATLWTLPARADVAAGSFAFTTTGALAGLVVPHRNGMAILPASALADSVDRLLKQRQGVPGWLGLAVQSLSPALAAATGAQRGVVVTWVDPRSPAAGSIQPADVLETMDDMTADLTEEKFRVRAARLLAGDAITFQVRRGTMAQPVRLTASPRPGPPAVLGLTMRRVRGGAEVVRVEPSSAAAVAGIREGDVITFAAGVQAPTPAQVTRAYAGASAGRPLVVGVSRGDAHLLFPVNTP